MKPFFCPLAVASVFMTSICMGAPIPESCQTSGFALGCQAWTFNRFTIMEAIEKTAAAGGKVIEFFPGQTFSTEKPEVKFDHAAADEVITAVKAQLAKHGVKAVNYGVVNIPKDEADARKIFEFARKFGLYAVTTESTEALDTIEKLAKEFDLKVGIHNHPRQPKNADYKVWDPQYILSIVKERDPRLGAAADTGHWIRSGLNPLDCLKTLEGRLVSLHLKDLNEKSPKAHDVPYGTGVANVRALLDELKRQGFAGNISIEYEYHWTNNLPEVTKCVEFVRGYRNQ